MRRRHDEELAAANEQLIVVGCVTLLVAIVVLILYARRQRSVDEPLGATLLVPSILDAVLGGNHRQRALEPYKYI